MAGLLALGIADPAGAQTVQPGITVEPGASAAPVGTGAAEDLLLQLEVFVNDVPRNLISAFTLHPDGQLVSSLAELNEIGIAIPQDLEPDLEIPLQQIPGLAFVYDDAAQTIHFTAEPKALQPVTIEGRPAQVMPDPMRPPLGLVLNYTSYASGARTGGSFAFEGISTAIESRLFGRFGLIENSAITHVGGGATSVTRLDSSYSYEDPAHLRTVQAGDLISGGFSWTRPIRMGGLQLRRSFGLRPDLVTIPLPTLTGTAAAPSTLDLYINNVRALGADVPQGPFAIAHPPIIYGGGVARLVLRDALGRQVVTSTSFYASPDLLSPGLTDFSAEIGFARRNYATQSNDYDGRLAASLSWRRGINQGLTLQAHAETVGSLFLGGGGAQFTVGSFGLASVAVAGSRTRQGTGGLVDLTFESRLPFLSLAFRTQRVFGDYQDVASWTAVVPPDIAVDRRVFGQPRELDSATVSFPLPWHGGAFGASYIYSRREDDRSRIVNFSFTQDFGRLSLSASAFRDFDLAGSTGLFLGISLPLGRGISASTGLSHNGGGTNGYAEVSRQGHHEPGAFGWVLRGAAGGRQELEGIARYSSRVARFEAGLLHSQGDLSGYGLMEGALTFIGGGLHASERVDSSFALVEVGAPDVPIFYENRPAGRTDRRGQLLVPNLAPFVANRIDIDPSNLPLDAEVAATSATVAPFNRVAVTVDLRVETRGDSALVAFVDPQGAPLELGSEVAIEGSDETFVIGYDGQAFLGGLEAENVALITTPDQARCRARFRHQPSPGQQVHIDQVMCELVR